MLFKGLIFLNCKNIYSGYTGCGISHYLASACKIPITFVYVHVSWSFIYSWLKLCPTLYIIYVFACINSLDIYSVLSIRKEHEVPTLLFNKAIHLFTILLSLVTPFRLASIVPTLLADFDMDGLFRFTVL